MASSSSANKVARVAARSAGGSKATKQSNWLFPAAIVAVVALGIGIVAFARDRNAGSNDNDTPPRAQLAAGQPADHWHAAFSINICGKELPALQDGPTDPGGIHTHGDGLIHIHPFSLTTAGARATMGKYFDQVNLKVTDDGIQMPDGAVYKEGETTCAGKPGELVMAHWKDARVAGTKDPDQIIRDDFRKVRLSEDLGAYTLAFEPEGTTDIPAPAAAADIVQLGAADGGAVPTGEPGDTGTTGPVEAPGSTEPSTPADGSSTTAPADGSTTSAPAGSTTTAGSGG